MNPNAVVLTSIGNSKKTSEFDRGFRGIGRLAGLGYCDELLFSTSFEAIIKDITEIVNANKQKLIPDQILIFAFFARNTGSKNEFLLYCHSKAHGGVRGFC